MTKLEKLLKRIMSVPGDVTFEELEKVLLLYGYEESSPGSGSSHRTFRKQNHPPITIPKHKPIKKVYVRMAKEIIEKGEYDEREN